MRRLLMEAKNKVSQGTIFNNAKVFDYSIANGVIISARCDIENSHHKTINYLPIVSLSDWIKNDLVRLLLKRIYKKTNSAMNNIFQNKGLSVNAARNLGFDRVIEKYFTTKEQKLLKEKAMVLHYYDKIEKSKLEKNEISYLLKSQSKVADELLKELIEHKLTSFFYLENCDYYIQENSKCEHYVILLRQIHSLPLKIALELTDGIKLEQEETIQVYFERNELTLALSEISSPFIEYIVQSCTEQFRIGIDRGSIVKLEEVL